MHCAFLLLASATLKVSLAAYTLYDAYNVSNFFDKFTFYRDCDPTRGYVDYVDRPTAFNESLASNQNEIVFGADAVSVPADTARGRKSIRLMSNATYGPQTPTLVILDLAHMPGNADWIWPSFWMLGEPDAWPLDGEIDIIEGINQQNHNHMNLITAQGCEVPQYPANGGSYNDCNQTECAIDAGDASSYGTGFNQAGGGVYAMEMASQAIRIWLFTRNQIPSNIQSGSPDPSGWGSPLGDWRGNSRCDITSHVKNLTIVFDITFCGFWGDTSMDQHGDAFCTWKTSTCTQHVQQHPQDYTEAYWKVNSLNVYQNAMP